MMNIDYNNHNTAKVFKNYVTNPFNNKAIREFCKYFPKSILQESLQTHKRMLSSNSFLHYNSLILNNEYKIELYKGQPNKNNVVFKVRLNNNGYRKYFYGKNINNDDFLLNKDWQGQFDDLNDLLVIEVNKHDYSKLRQ